MVARRVLAPTRHRHAAPTAIPAARRGQHQRIIAVGHQLSARHRRVRRGEAARHARCLVEEGDSAGLHFRRQPGNCDIARHALLQQQFGGLHHRLGMEAFAHGAVMDDVVDAQDHHALVVRHVGLDDDAGRVFGQPRPREIDRLVPAIVAPRAHSAETVEILACGDGLDHRRQPAGIGRDDSVFAEAALQAQVRDAEAGILIILLAVQGVILRFRNAPRNIQALGIGNLATHRRLVAERQQAAGRLMHDQRWHQIFEHRA